MHPPILTAHRPMYFFELERTGCSSLHFRAQKCYVYWIFFKNVVAHTVGTSNKSGMGGIRNQTILAEINTKAQHLKIVWKLSFNAFNCIPPTAPAETCIRRHGCPIKTWWLHWSARYFGEVMELTKCGLVKTIIVYYSAEFSKEKS